MKKRILSFVLVVVMILSLVPMSTVGVSAETLTDEQGIIYTLGDDGTYYIVSGYEGEHTEVVIPAEYNGLPVKEIGERAFSRCANLTSVEIPESIIGIDDYAFSYCDSLTNIEVPNSVLWINMYAFYSCTSLTSVVIGDSVTSIDTNSWAFNGCSSLESITVSTGNTYYKSIDNCLIKMGALVLGCKNSIIPSDGSVTRIANYAFSGCFGLANIEIPDSVTEIGVHAFVGCKGLTSIVIPDSVTKIGDGAFRNCARLTSVIIGDSLTSIGWDAFRYCSSLTSIDIPNSVTSIGNSAFYRCESLTSIIIPNSVTSIGYETFYGCNNLTDIYCEAEAQPESWDSGWNGDCDANVHWGYTSEMVAADELSLAIQEIETNLVESDYAEAEWADIQEAINNAKEFSTDGKSESEIRAEIEALENAILLNPKKAEFGDLNGDEKVDSLDYLFVKRGCFGTYDLSNVEFARADINRDGQTNSADYLLVKRIAFGTYKVS